MLAYDAGVDVLPERSGDHNDGDWAQVAERVVGSRFAHFPILIYRVRIVNDVAARRQTRGVDQQMIHSNRPNHRQRQLVHVDISTEDSREQVDQQGNHLTFSNADVAEYERSRKVLLPLRRVEGHHHHDDQQKYDRIRAKS